jgi:D-3-phosphoglycerate dehydrogenase
LFEISKNVLDFAKNLKMIIVFGTGFNNIDLKEAKKRNILICNVPDYCTEAVAEHTVGLILNTVRLASVAESNLRKGEWNPHKYKGFELKGKTLGIIGYGNIGKRVGEIAKRGFGMKINYINSQSDKTNLNFLLKESDILSINSSLNKKTLGMLNKKEFSLMKNKVVIVNTGRFLVLNKKELIRNLKSGKIFGVGLDVFDKEPISMNDPLLKINNVVLTPHLSFKTEESEFRISEIVMNTIISFIKNKPINVVK